jgi:putative flippase GtrA
MIAAGRLLRHSFIRFAAVGLFGLGIDVSLVWIFLRYLTASRALAVTGAFAATYALNFALNRTFSFRSRGEVGIQVVRFLPQVLLDYALTLGAVEALTGLGLGVLVARVLAGATNAAVNYSAYRWWTFRSGGVSTSAAEAASPALVTRSRKSRSRASSVAE